MKMKISIIDYSVNHINLLMKYMGLLDMEKNVVYTIHKKDIEGVHDGLLHTYAQYNNNGIQLIDLRVFTPITLLMRDIESIEINDNRIDFYMK